VKPEQVNGELLKAFWMAWIQASERGDDAPNRAALAAVLPVYERQVREQVAKELLERSARPGWSTKFRDGLRYAAAYLVRGEQP
jgi:hypothetical protein